MLSHAQPQPQRLAGRLRSRAVRASRRRPQRGISLVIALMVLVALTLTGVALIRSMDTTNLVAGNLSFKQATLHGADQGVESAIAWLAANNGTGFLDADVANGFYTASTIGNDAIAALGSGTPEDFWRHYTSNDSSSVPCYLPFTTNTLTGAAVCTGSPTRDATSGNIVGFIVQRLCNSAGNVNGAGCAVPINYSSSGSVVTGSGNNEGAGDVSSSSGSITASTMTYYRITVRAQGPNNTVSYVQSIVAM